MARRARRSAGSAGRRAGSAGRRAGGFSDPRRARSDVLPFAAGEGRQVWSIAELTRAIKEELEAAFGRVWVEGEVSNLRLPGSGHAYFTLKDADAQLACVAFRGVASRFGAHLADGAKVRAFGRLTVYEPRGNYQVVCERVEPAGLGELQAAFEALKKKLAAEGLFDEARRKPLPFLPRAVAVVTSPTGAAIRDILNVAMRRFGAPAMTLLPVRVQGAGAAAEIAEAIDTANKWNLGDVLVIGRGGGSIEDLWAFNEEVVIRAIASSRLPVVSAVGHETDFTLSDFAADARAPTPSAAAEIVWPRLDEIAATLDERAAKLRRALAVRAESARHAVEMLAARPAFARPLDLVNERRERVDDLALSLGTCVRDALARARERLAHGAGKLSGLSPVAALGRGYSVTTDARGRPVTDAGRLKLGDAITTRFARGRARSRVEEVDRGET